MESSISDTSNIMKKQATDNNTAAVAVNQGSGTIDRTTGGSPRNLKKN